MKDDILVEPIAPKVVKAILNYYGFTPKQLTDKLNLGKSSQVFNLSNGKTATISTNMAEKLKATFPDLNYDWLITGKGSMFEQKEKSTTTDNDMSAVMLHLVAIINQQSAKIDELAKEVKDLKLQVATLQPQPRAYGYNIDNARAADESILGDK